MQVGAHGRDSPAVGEETVYVALRKGAPRELAESLGEVHSHAPSRLLPHLVTLKVPAGQSREDFLAALNAHEGEALA